MRFRFPSSLSVCSRSFATSPHKTAARQVTFGNCIVRLEWRSIGPNEHGRTHRRRRRCAWRSECGLRRQRFRRIVEDNERRRGRRSSNARERSRSATSPSRRVIRKWSGRHRGSRTCATAFRSATVFTNRLTAAKRQHMGLKDSERISAIAIHPQNPDIVYIGALGARLWSKRRTRRVHDHRQRQDLDQNALHRQSARRGRSRYRSD